MDGGGTVPSHVALETAPRVSAQHILIDRWRAIRPSSDGALACSNEPHTVAPRRSRRRCERRGAAAHAQRHQAGRAYGRMARFAAAEERAHPRESRGARAADSRSAAARQRNERKGRYRRAGRRNPQGSRLAAGKGTVVVVGHQPTLGATAALALTGEAGAVAHEERRDLVVIDVRGWGGRGDRGDDAGASLELNRHRNLWRHLHLLQPGYVQLEADLRPLA